MAQLEMFSFSDDRIRNLDANIRLQWMFAHVFWPTDAQVFQLADHHKVLSSTVLEHCDQEFIRHCEAINDHQL